MKKTKLTTSESLKLRLAENERKIDDFNEFALKCKDSKGQPFYVPTTTGGIATNFHCELTFARVQLQYSNYLKANK